MARALTVALFLAASLVESGAHADDCPRALKLASDGDAVRATNLDEAISSYEQARVAAPTSHTLAWKLALLYAKKEKWEKEAATLADACRLAPTFASYFHEWGVALVHLHQLTDAKQHFERAIALDAQFGAPHRELAQLLVLLDDEAGAADHLNKAIRLRPDDVTAYVALADLYYRQGHVEEAIAVAREGATWMQDDSPDRFALHALWYRALEEKGDVAAALAKAEEAKVACRNCNEHGQQIVFFDLGRLYAGQKPPRRSEAASNLLSFQKAICKGGSAQRYADQCSATQELMKRVRGSTP